MNTTNKIIEAKNRIISGEFSESDDLPKSVITIDGQNVDTSTENWKFRIRNNDGDLLNINFESLYKLGNFKADVINIIKQYLIHRLKRVSTFTVLNDFKAFINFFDWFKKSNYSLELFEWKDLSESIMRSFLTFGVKNTPSKGNNFSKIRCFYSWGIDNYSQEFSLYLYRILEGIRAPGNLKGHNVRFSEPLKGPFNEDEKCMILQTLRNQDLVIEDRTRIVLGIHLELGLNTLQTILIKKSDYIVVNENGEEFHFLDVPRIKKRLTVRAVRRRPITKALGELIKSTITDDLDTRLIDGLSDEYPKNDIIEIMKEFSEKADLISPRTKERLNLTPRRFRTTLATGMAEQGSSVEMIADVLDHTDTQNVVVYVETVSTIADVVEAAVDKTLEPLVERFKGKLINSFDEPGAEVFANNQIYGDIPHIAPNVLDLGGIGGCGRDIAKKGLCNLFPPLTCYLCPSFGALKGAPHEKVKVAIETYINDNQGKLDQKTLSQFNDILIAVNTILEIQEGK